MSRRWGDLKTARFQRTLWHFNVNRNRDAIAIGHSDRLFRQLARVIFITRTDRCGDRKADAIDLGIVLELTEVDDLDLNTRIARDIADDSSRNVTAIRQLFEEISSLPTTDSALVGLTGLLLVLDDSTDHTVLADSTCEANNRDAIAQRKSVSQLGDSG